MLSIKGCCKGARQATLAAQHPLITHQSSWRRQAEIFCLETAIPLFCLLLSSSCIALVPSLNNGDTKSTIGDFVFCWGVRGWAQEEGKAGCKNFRSFLSGLQLCGWFPPATCCLRKLDAKIISAPAFISLTSGSYLLNARTLDSRVVVQHSITVIPHWSLDTPSSSIHLPSFVLSPLLLSCLCYCLYMYIFLLGTHL